MTILCLQNSACGADVDAFIGAQNLNDNWQYICICSNLYLIFCILQFATSQSAYELNNTDCDNYINQFWDLRAYNESIVQYLKY